MKQERLVHISMGESNTVVSAYIDDSIALTHVEAVTTVLLSPIDIANILYLWLVPHSPPGWQYRRN